MSSGKKRCHAIKDVSRVAQQIVSQLQGPKFDPLYALNPLAALTRFTANG